MTRRDVAFYTAILVLLGAGWGITQPLSKIAVSTGYQHFGLVFWQMALGAVLLTVVCALRRVRLPMQGRHLRFYVVLAMIGTILPNSASYQAVVHLPAGVLSLLLSMVPMWAFPIALLLGNDSFSLRRLVGLACGLGGVMLILVPGSDASPDLPVLWVGVGLIAGVFYALESNYVARWGVDGLDAVQALLGASLVGALIMLPLSLLTGQFIVPKVPPDTAMMALVASSVVHVTVYATFIWLVGRAGAVFAVQVSYLVTGFGLLWAKLILSESYPAAIWVALAAMFLGMYLVQPRHKAALAATPAIGDGAG